MNAKDLLNRLDSTRLQLGDRLDALRSVVPEPANLAGGLTLDASSLLDAGMGANWGTVGRMLDAAAQAGRAASPRSAHATRPLNPARPAPVVDVEDAVLTDRSAGVASAVRLAPGGSLPEAGGDGPD